jgi:cystathionine beta-synthase
MVGAGEPLEVALSALRHGDAFIVLDDGKPTGVLSRQDLLGHLAS